MILLDAQFERSTSSREHVWVTVVNPLNHRLLLQACDNCGVVKSENSIVRACQAPLGQAIISGSMNAAQQVAN